MDADHTEFVLRIAAAGLCGLIVGIDREVKNKPLGARSFMLVCIGCCAWTIITMNFSIAVSEEHTDLKADPTRVVQALVGAIGFLGAGAIMTSQSDGRLRGVASGAAIWGVGAIGVAIGLGFLFEGFALAAVFFLVLNVYGLIMNDTPSEEKEPSKATNR